MEKFDEYRKYFFQYLRKFYTTVSLFFTKVCDVGLLNFNNSIRNKSDMPGEMEDTFSMLSMFLSTKRAI